MKTSHIADIVEITKALEGKLEITDIKYSQQLLSEEYRGKSVNDLHFLKRAYGLDFYTSRSSLDLNVILRGKKLPLYVVSPISLSVYEISNSGL